MSMNNKINEGDLEQLRGCYFEYVCSDKWSVGAKGICFWHNGLSESWAFGPMGHFVGLLCWINELSEQ